jgi:uncharacterized surface protein with fasciclin (FAS1) repeats
MKVKVILAVAALALAALGMTIAQTTAANTKEQTITQVVATNPNFSTLLAAVQAAGLGDTLAGTGPFTVFAPTNAAFAKIPKADLDKLLADKAALTKVLTYHVVAGKVMAKDVLTMNGKGAKTVQGQEIMIGVAGSNVTLNGNSKVTAVDIETKNGVIHVIDTVIMPK